MGVHTCAYVCMHMCIDMYLHRCHDRYMLVYIRMHLHAPAERVGGLNYTFNADVWSLGLLVYQCCTAQVTVTVFRTYNVHDLWEMCMDVCWRAVSWWKHRHHHAHDSPAHFKQHTCAC
jgi:hypothetical protein